MEAIQRRVKWEAQAMRRREAINKVVERLMWLQAAEVLANTASLCGSLAGCRNIRRGQR
jgi:hypothetical protein